MVTNSQGALVERPPNPKELGFYDRINDPLAAVTLLGNAIAKSGMLGEISQEAGQLLAVECMASGVPPLSLKRRYHITKFGLMQQSSNVMSEFQKAGGVVKELSRTAELAKAEVSLGDQKYTVELSWKQALEEPFVYVGKEAAIVEWLRDPKKRKELTLKPKYATPLSRAQMLWWRLICDAIRSHWPEINGGIYTPEEIGEGDESEDVIEGEFTAPTKTATQVAETPTAEVVQVAVEEVSPSTVAEVKSAEQPNEDATSCTAEQSALIRDLFAELNLSAEQQQSILAKRKANVIRNLTSEQADVLIANLKDRIATINANPKKLEGEFVDAPCRDDQVAKIKSQLVELNQAMPGIVDRFKAKLSECGVGKIAELSIRDADRVIQQLQAKQIEAFFEMSLSKWVPSEPKN